MQEMQEMEFNPWAGKISWSRRWQPTPVLLPGKFHGEWSLEGYNVCGCKELDTAEYMRVHTKTHTHTHTLHYPHNINHIDEAGKVTNNQETKQSTKIHRLMRDLHVGLGQ